MSEYTPAERKILLDNMQRMEGFFPGSRAHRNNNPGNIEFGDYARGMGATGGDGRFAIFPSYEAGRAAQEKLLFEGRNYRNLTLEQAINRWAPKNENDTAAYIRAMHRGMPTAGAAPVSMAGASAAPATASPPSAAGAGARASAAPSSSQMQLPPPPTTPTRIGSAGSDKGSQPVIIPQQIGQNLSDRGIAQVATGGMGIGDLNARSA